jgi:hypothetical protein
VSLCLFSEGISKVRSFACGLIMNDVPGSLA